MCRDLMRPLLPALRTRPRASRFRTSTLSLQALCRARPRVTSEPARRWECISHSLEQSPDQTWSIDRESLSPIASFAEAS